MKGVAPRYADVLKVHNGSMTVTPYVLYPIPQGMLHAHAHAKQQVWLEMLQSIKFSIFWVL